MSYSSANSLPSNNSRLQWLSELPFSSPEYTGVEAVDQPHTGVQPPG